MDTAGDYAVLVRAFRLALTIEGLRPSTIRHYVQGAERFAADAADCAPDDVTPDCLRGFVLALQTHCSPRTVHEVQMGLRRFFASSSVTGRLALALSVRCAWCATRQGRNRPIQPKK